MYDFSIRSVQLVLAMQALQHSDRSVRSALARRRVRGLGSAQQKEADKFRKFRPVGCPSLAFFGGVRLVLLPFSGMGCYCSPTFRGVSCY